MAYNFETNQFDPPPLLVDIFKIQDAFEKTEYLADFVAYKNLVCKLDLTQIENCFELASRLDTEIASGSWHSPFYQIYTWDEWEIILDVFRVSNYELAADLIEQARNLYYRGRSDLKEFQAMKDAGITGWHLEGKEEEKFYKLGRDFVEKTGEFHPNIYIWAEMHKDGFQEFER